MVAIALMCCMQLSANLSPVNIDIEFPFTINAISPDFTVSPSCRNCSIFRDESTSLKIISANSIPAIIPSSFINKCALLVAVVGILANEV